MKTSVERNAAIASQTARLEGVRRSFFSPLSPMQFIMANLLISLIILAFFFRNAFSDAGTFLISLLWSFAICSTQWLGPLTINHFLDKKFKWIERPVVRTILELILLMVWSVGALILVQSVMLYIIYGFPVSQSWESIKSTIVITFLIALFLSLFFTLVGFFISWRKAVLREAELRSLMISFKYEALRAQLNPHFLFNSFNVLSDLVYSDQGQAVKFIRQLSDLFHYVLDSREKELVPISEELRFLESYIYLLKIRFGEKLKVITSVRSNMQGLVVPMSLQLLVENAVKHNEVSEKYPLEIRINSNNGYLEVENARKPKDTGETSKNTGLANIIQQYGLFTDAQVEVNETNDIFRVRIPVINQIIS
ncbi:MAG TPA: histidine kinase [Lentimicrobium sp.]|nr:histidine kinase [Lentimicrobium sp.]